MLVTMVIFFVSCLSEREVKDEVDQRNGETPTVDTKAQEEDDNTLTIDTSQVKNANGDATSGNEVSKAVDTRKTFKVEPVRAREVSTSGLSRGSAGVEQIKNSLREGNYREVLRLTEGKNDFYSKYYRGIVYMSMMLQKKKFSPSQRIIFRNQAEELLREVGYQADDDDLRARGLLWYGVTVDLAYVDLKNKKKAIAAFYKIESSSLRDSLYYNDALFYAAQVYAKMGWYGVARNYFRRAGKPSSNDSVIYDYVDNRFYPVDVASEIGFQRLQSYVNGYNKNYK